MVAVSVEKKTVSGSGPAYAFLLAEAMEDAARAQGLPDDVAAAAFDATATRARRGPM